jgi:SAM-dependent methyltransferase
MLAKRGDLAVTGIDAASVPGSRDRRLRLLSRTPMEDLPFQAQTFDGAVSQFGLEYGHVNEAVQELRRVLRPGARFSFIIHHSDSLVVRGHRNRDQAILDVLGSPVERAYLSGDSTRLDRELRVVRGILQDVIVCQVASALRCSLGRTFNERASIWTAIVDALRPERTLIEALLDSCVAQQAIGDWTAILRKSLEVSEVSLLTRQNGEIIAWLIEGSKPIGS